MLEIRSWRRFRQPKEVQRCGAQSHSYMVATQADQPNMPIAM